MMSLFFIVPVVRAATVAPMEDSNGRTTPKCSVDFEKHASSFRYRFDFLHGIFCYFLPLIIICAVYIAILYKLYRHTRMSTVGKRTSISLSRVVRCSVMVVAFYFICWTPYWTMRLVTPFIAR